MAFKIDPKTGIATDETGNTVQAANPIAPVATTPATPAPAQTNQFYRIGQDIYNASDNIKIGATDWQNNWATSGAKEVNAATLYSPDGKAQVVGVGTPQASRLLSSGYSLSKPSTNSITTDSLADATPLDIPEPKPVITGGNDAMIAGVEQDQATIAANIKTLTPPATDLSTQIEDLLGDVGDLAGKQTGRGQAQITAENEAGVGEFGGELADINAQIKSKIAERNAFTANFRAQNQAIEGKGANNLLVSQLEGKQAQLYKMYLAEDNVKTAEIGMLQAQALGVQGKLDQAQAMADRSVDLKYDDIKAELDAKIAQITAIEPQLTKEEQTYADAVKLMLDDKKAETDRKIEEEKQQFTVGLNLIADGYQKITGPSQLKGLTEDQLLRLPNGDIYKKPGGDIYKKPGEDTDTSEWDYARTILDSNPDASDAELKTGLLENTDLSVTEINALIKERGATEDADEAKIYSDEWFRDVVSTSVNNGLTIDDVYKRLVENYDIGEIFKVAKEAGYAKVLTGKEKDIKRYLESLK